jgi:hypothetical protein
LVIETAQYKNRANCAQIYAGFYRRTVEQQITQKGEAVAKPSIRAGFSL